ncbi:dihydrolipoamide acetyltransferase family protein [Demequina sp.]|uniref:dihydrolipoamide acetyltransferase family protein n=1 Tax=Demequina sp. TaxID=2050685 RepID=UPI003D1056AC
MPKFQIFNLPDAGEGLTEADIITWLVAAGDTVEVNQPIVEIETAKSLVELPSPYDGVIAELLVAEGETVDVGAPIVRFEVEGEDVTLREDAGPDVTLREDAGPEPAPVVEAPAPEPAPAQVAAPAQAESASGAVLVGYGVKAGSAKRRERVGDLEPIGGEDDDFPVLAKPPVRKLAADLGIDLTTVTPSGPGGIVTREDVEQHAKATSAKVLATYEADDQPWLESGVSTPDGRATRVPVKSVRKRTAEAMVASAFTAPHVTVFQTVDVTATMDLVAKLKTDREFADVRVTPLLIVAKALLLAARRHPEINASWDDAAQEIVYKHYVNLGIAVSTPRGLVVPNIKDAHRLPLHGLASRIQDLTAEGRAGRTTPAAMSDGTITITNVGALGIDTGTPILNPGEAAILAFGAIREQPWVHNGEIQIRWVTQLALSFDHRLVDGELGARVLADVARVMNDPAHGLVWG